MSEVYRLPPEPPVGTTVRPEPDDGTRWTRADVGNSAWRVDANRRGGGIGRHWSWSAVLGYATSGDIVVVEPDPHPTPWTFREDSDTFAEIFDANGESIADIGGNDRYAIAQRIVDAVNKAATS